MPQRILVIEDQPKIAELICKYLNMEQFSFHHIVSGTVALKENLINHFDLILLDLMLPDMNGINVCTAIRKRSDIPIIMLTARVDEADRLLGFAKGADDYVCKPFNPKELMARIHAVLRRAHKTDLSKHKLIQGALELDMVSYVAKCCGSELNLTKLEFSILSALLARPNKVFTREELLSLVQSKYTEGYTRNIDTHIKNLRRKLDHENLTTSRIKSIYGVGYKLGDTRHFNSQADPTPDGVSENACQ